ncbi:MAG: cobyrinic acid a,c-diamide synthase [Cyanobacteria bacterium P01_A01_bin.105]
MLAVDFSENEHILGSLPLSARHWLESLPWQQRRYLLSLCHVICANPPERQAEFLDDYTADGVVSRIIHDHDTQQRVYFHLRRFHIATQLTEPTLRQYIRQFYLHSAQTLQQPVNQYLETALKLTASTQEHNSVLSYILGFEIMKLLFQMSWEQHERLYRLQATQEDFLRAYIRPIQHTHRLNGIIVPRDEGQFFARREYFIQQPKLSKKRLDTLIMATFAATTVTELGFSVIRHPQAIQFDYEHILENEPARVIFD